MNNISLQQIQYFKIAMKCSSFSQAAKLAYTTQSTISKNIAALEKIMGEPLFTRQKKGIMPTQRAILLDLELTEIYDKIDLLLNNTRQSKQERVSIGFCQSIDFSSSIPEFFSLFRRENYIPTAVIKLQCCENSDVVNGVLDGSIDLGFILSDVITNFERVSDHCSNIAVCLVQVNEDEFDTHAYLDELRQEDNLDFQGKVMACREKYQLPPTKQDRVMEKNAKLLAE